MNQQLQLRTVAILASIILSQYCFSQAAGSYLYTNQYAVNSERADIPVNNPSGNTVTLEAQVMMNVVPTSYTAIFAVTQTARDAFQADSILSSRILQVRQALNAVGIPDEDIHIDAVAMVPTYSMKIEEKKFSKRATEIPTGFEMKKNIHILFYRHDILDIIISEMAFADIYDLVKVEYNISGTSGYLEELRKAAKEVVDDKRSNYGNFGLHLEVTNFADGLSVSYPAERYKAYVAANSGASIQAVSMARDLHQTIVMNGRNNQVNIDGYPIKDDMGQTLLVTTAEKNKTIFYDRMPYNQFDKIINADTEEPCIQMFYNLRVVYSQMTEEQWEVYKTNKEAMKKAACVQENGVFGRRGRKH